MSDRREFLMLSKTSKGTEDIAGWYLSEKLDGMRCFWDGGVSRDVPIDEVPWSNLGKGTSATATGLWSRYANPIYAPDWFLNSLPACPLDGELYAGRGEFQTTMSTCRKKVPIDSEWQNIQFQVFSTPQLQNVFRSGQIKNPNLNHYIFMDQCEYFYANYADENLHHLVTNNGSSIVFEFELEYLQEWLEGSNPSIVSLLSQLKLPNDVDLAWDVANQRTQNIIESGGEGSIIRNPHAPWVPKRVGDVLKLKPCLDDEAIIIGATSGRKGKTGKFHGLVGNFIVKYKDAKFELSGFTDEERAILDDEVRDWAYDNPGKEIPTDLVADGSFRFKLGDQITFKYRELSKAGIPKDARYFRERSSE